jgi:membrane protein DedA with SNARE-associated domain
MTIESSLIEFRYLALVVGLQLPAVILIGFFVTYTVDQFFFWIGHSKGKQFLINRPKWALKAEKARSLMAGNLDLLVFGFRFMYGLRVVLPMVFGMSGISPKRFAILNFFSAILWTVGLGLAGYLFGHLAEAWLADVRKYELWIFLGVLILGAGIWLYSRYAPKIGMREKDIL